MSCDLVDGEGLSACGRQYLIQASYALARAIVTEAGLSFLGLGVPPPTPSWGNMLGDARTFLQDAWWFDRGIAVLAGGADVVVVPLS